MLVLDSDHLSALQRGGPQAERLKARLDAATDVHVATTIVSVDEQLRSWLSDIHDARTPQRLIEPYEKLRKFLLYFSGWEVLSFNEAAATELARLQSLGLSRVGANDLRIAAIVMSLKATLLSANLRDFRLIPDLVVEDWVS